jgi:hypothetical protein
MRRAHLARHFDKFVHRDLTARHGLPQARVVLVFEVHEQRAHLGGVWVRGASELAVDCRLDGFGFFEDQVDGWMELSGHCYPGDKDVRAPESLARAS